MDKEIAEADVVAEAKRIKLEAAEERARETPEDRLEREKEEKEAKLKAA